MGSAVSKRRIGGAVGWVGLRSGRTPSDAALLSFADAVPAGGEGLVVLPFLLAERGPLWNDDLTGAYLGLRAHHTRGHLVRAAVEGVALQLGTVLDALEPLGPVSSIRATGGVFRSRPWREVVAAALSSSPLPPRAPPLAQPGLGCMPSVRSPHRLPASSDLRRRSRRGPDVLVADPRDVATYRAVRAGVGTLLDQLRESAHLLSRTGSSTP